MNRILPAATTFVLLSATSSRAETFSGPGMAEITESLWMWIFSGGIVFGLVAFAALKIWRTIKHCQR